MISITCIVCCWRRKKGNNCICNHQKLSEVDWLAIFTPQQLTCSAWTIKNAQVSCARSSYLLFKIWAFNLRRKIKCMHFEEFQIKSIWHWPRFPAWNYPAAVKINCNQSKARDTQGKQAAYQLNSNDQIMSSNLPKMKIGYITLQFLTPKKKKKKILAANN